jgi:hypothetical protein
VPSGLTLPDCHILEPSRTQDRQLWTKFTSSLVLSTSFLPSSLTSFVGSLQDARATRGKRFRGAALCPCLVCPYKTTFINEPRPGRSASARPYCYTIMHVTARDRQRSVDYAAPKQPVVALCSSMMVRSALSAYFESLGCCLRGIVRSYRPECAHLLLLVS